ncbi:MAG: hypothetical protein U0350_00615 [Caldilineaceae bacterium]
MSELTATLPPAPTRGRLRLWVGLASVIILALIGGFYVYQTRQTNQAPRANTQTVTAQDFESQWGIHVTQIGITADGGLVDFRYRVIDPDKAWRMLSNLNTVPVLIAEDSNTLINTASSMTKQHDLNAGQIYFILFHNDNGAIKSGRPVSVVIGKLRLEHIIVL